MENKRFKIDIDEILKAKVKKKLPKFLVNFLKRRIHQEEINHCIEHAEHPQGVEFFDEAHTTIQACCTICKQSQSS